MAIVRKQSRKSAKPSSRRNTKAVKPIGNKKVAKVIVHKTTGEPGDVELQDLSVSANGTYYAPDGIAYKSIIVNVGEYEKPVVGITLNPATTLYDVTVDTLQELVITANVTKKTNNISKIEIYVDGTILKSVTDMPSGGVVTYTKTWDPAINTAVNVKVIAYDTSNKSTTVTKDIKFVGKNYYGTVADTVTALNETGIKALNNTLIGTKNYVYSGITMDYGKVAYSYPATFGVLKSIRDVTNNIDYTKSFTQTIVTVDGIAYYCYLLNDPVAATNVQLTFA